MKNSKDATLLSASAIKGIKVSDIENTGIGEIIDVMIDTSTGYVEYVVLSVNSGFPNKGNKYFAAPLRAFSRDEDHEKWRLDINKKRLESAPGFDEDNWPTGTQTEFLDVMYKYYDVEPHDYDVEPYESDGPNDPVLKSNRRENIEVDDGE